MHNRVVFFLFNTCRGWIVPVWLGLSQGMLLAQVPSTLPSPESITDRQGLPQAFVPAIVQDRQGFIWMATNDGLCRYDGNAFKVFQPTTDGRPALSSPGVANIVTDHRGQLWIATHQGDLDVFDPLRETFINFSHTTFYQRHFGRDTLHNYFPDRQNRLWLSLRQRGLVCIDLRTHQVRRFRHEATNPYSLASDSVAAVVTDQQGGIWVATGVSLDRLDERTGRFIHYRHQPGKPNTLPDEPIKGLYVRKNGDLLLLSPWHLTLLRVKTGQIQVFRLPVEIQKFVQYPHFATDNQGNDYFGRRDWLFRFNEREGLQVLTQLTNAQRVQSIHIDHSDVLWVGTDGTGVLKYNLRAGSFQGQPYQTAFHIDLLNRHLGVPAAELPYFPANTSPYDFRSTFDGRGNVWFNINSTPFYRLNLRTKKITAVPFPFPFQAHRDYTPAPMATDPSGRVWVVHDSLVRWYDETAGRWQAFPHRIRPGVRSGIFQVVVDEQALWLATGSKGLYRVDRISGRIQRYAHQPRNPASLSSDNLFCLFADPLDAHRLWVGTFGGGLCQFDKRTGLCRRFTKQDGLPNNVVYAAVPDRQGFVWVATNQGLCRLNRRTFQTRTYTREDGLVADEFNRFHFLQLPDERILLGGLEGITSFYPRQVRDDTYQPPVQVTSIQINNRPLLPGQLTDSLPVQAISQLVLPHDQNFVTISFAAMQYNRHHKIKYRYQLENLNKDWIETERPVAVYTDLSPGRYLLRLNASNTSGVWSQQVRTLVIRIQPPWWVTWWAYGLYAGVVGGIGYGLFRVYLNRLQLRQAVARQQQEAEQFRVLDELKTRFFSNITHEFRTPLTLIVSPIEQMARETTDARQRNRLQTVLRNAHQVLRLINQLLDLSKLEAGGMPVEEVRGHLGDFVGQLVQSLEAGAEVKAIGLTYHHQVTAEYRFDPGKLEQIVYNLVANAVKFTPQGGQVDVSLNPLIDREGVELSVTDTGIGIPAESISRIFERFYRVTDSHTGGREGTGIGLALVKELVDTQGGTISVRSRVNEGSTFTVQLPYRLAQPIPGAAPEAIPLGPTLVGEEAEKPVILLVEDNVELIDFIAESLPLSYQIYRATNGSDGLAQAMDLVPDLIISDVMMPGMNGFGLCGHLKADERTSHVPVILLTAKAALDSRVQGLSAGADDYLTKPFHVQELQLRVHNLLEQKRRLREWVRSTLTSIEPPISESDSLVVDPFLNQLYQFIENNLDDSSFGVEEMADQVNLSRMHLHRKVKALTDLPVSDLIRTYRLRRATEFLRQGRAVAETAYLVGFETPSHFTKCFREQYRKTPREFAAQAK